MATSGVEKSKKKTEKKLAAREEAKLLAGFMGVMNNMRKQVRAARGRGRGGAAGPVALAAGLLCHGASEAHSAWTPGGRAGGRWASRGRCVTGLLQFSVKPPSIRSAGGYGAVRSRSPQREASRPASVVNQVALLDKILPPLLI